MIPPGEFADVAFGILSQAKSRVGSHISDTAVGRYAPTDAATVVPTFWDVLLIIPMNVPLCFLSFVGIDSEPRLTDLPRSACESLPPGLILRSLWDVDDEIADEASPLRDCGLMPSLNI